MEDDKETLFFRLPLTWESEALEKLSAQGSWSDLGRAFYNAGVVVDLDEEEGVRELELEFDAVDEEKVRQILKGAQSGLYGPDVQTSWEGLEEYHIEAETS